MTTRHPAAPRDNWPRVVFKSIFSPSKPKVQPPPPPPEPSDPEVEKARTDELLKDKRRRGLAATRLTGSDIDLGPTTKTRLGQ